nr:epidermal growth factor receptor kinase substrate 8-like isoform X2 [Petromyzon marinus]
MYLQVEPNSISLLDCHTKEQLEKFDILWIQQCKVEAGDASIGRLLALILKDPQEDFPDIYLFQTAEANIIQSDIESGVADARSTVKKIRPETLRLNKEKLERMGIREDCTDDGSAQLSQGRSRGSHSRPPMPFMDQGMQPPPSSQDNELKLMNSLLDEIEAFVRRLQKIQEALNEMGKRKKKKSKGKKKSSGEGVLTLRARPPTKEEFTDHFQKFKLLLNLLSDMKLQLKNPPANDMLHHLMRPLQMMVLMSGGPDVGRTILSPPLSKITVEFMKATLTSQEKVLWNNLGDAWTKPESEWPKGWKSSPYTPRLKEPIGNQLGFPAQPTPGQHIPPSPSTAHPPTAYPSQGHPPPAHPPPAHPPPAQPAPAEPPEAAAVASHAVAHKSGSLDRGERLNPGIAASLPQPYVQLPHHQGLVTSEANLQVQLFCYSSRFFSISFRPSYRCHFLRHERPVRKPSQRAVHHPVLENGPSRTVTAAQRQGLCRLLRRFSIRIHCQPQIIMMQTYRS